MMRPKALAMIATLALVCLIIPGRATPNPNQNTDSAAKPTEAEIKQLVQQLGSASFVEREKAHKALEGLGEVALPALKEAAQKSEDAELRRRASDLLRMIEARLAQEKLRRPTLISVAYDRTPVPAVIEDLQKRTGVVFQQDVKLLQRMEQKQVTLRLTEKPLWEVVDQVLSACGLRPAAPQLPDEQTKALVLPQAWTLEEGKADPASVIYAGCVRIRILALQKDADKNWQGWLEICVEPQRYIIRGQPRFRETLLLDQTGQAVKGQVSLEAIQIKSPEEERMEQLAQQLQKQMQVQGIVQIQVVQVQIGGNARIIAPGGRLGQPVWRSLMRLQLRDLAENKVPAVLQAVLELEPFAQHQLTIEKPLEAVGKTFGEANQFRVLIRDAAKDGQTVRITVKSDDLPNAQPPVQVPGAIQGIAATDADALTLQLFDQKGNLLPVVGQQRTFTIRGNARSMELTFRFQLPDANAEPARLIVTNRSSPVILDIPVRIPLDKISP